MRIADFGLLERSTDHKVNGKWRRVGGKQRLKIIEIIRFNFHPAAIFVYWSLILITRYSSRPFLAPYQYPNHFVFCFLTVPYLFDWLNPKSHKSAIRNRKFPISNDLAFHPKMHSLLLMKLSNYCQHGSKQRRS